MSKRAIVLGVLLGFGLCLVPIAQAAVVTLGVSTNDIGESGTVLVTVHADGAHGNIAVHLTFTGSAVMGFDQDYTFGDPDFWVPTDSTSITRNLNIRTDTRDEDDEEIIIDIVSISGQAGHTIGTPGQQIVTISDDDASPTVTLSLAGSPMAEAAGEATVTATLSAVSGRSATVDLGFAGTATLSADYTASAASITIAPGSTTGTITLTAIQDIQDEENETAIVSIDGVTNCIEGGTAVTASITDDDTAPTVDLTLAGSPLAENGGVSTVTATLSQTYAQLVTVNLGFTGTAANTADYTRSAETIAIAAGATSGTITLTGVDDTLGEGNETVIVSIVSVINAPAPVGESVTAVITDDDPEVTITGNGVEIANGDATADPADNTEFGTVIVAGGSSARTFTIINDGPGALNLTGTPAVAVSGTDAAGFTVTGMPSTPIAPGDSTSFTVTFDPSSEGLKSATLTIENNDANENPYVFAIRGAGASTAEMEVQSNATVIADGDTTPDLSDFTDFGSADITTGSVARTFAIRNTGIGDLLLTGTPLVALAGDADFTVTTQPSASTVVSPGEVSFVVTFDPASTGLQTAVVTIQNNDADESPYTFTIQGAGTAAPEIEVRGNATAIVSGDVTPDAADHTDFGSAEILTVTVDRTFTVMNTGNAPLNLTGTPRVTVSGADAALFTVTQDAATPVAPGLSTSFTIRFDPASSGAKAASVSIASDDASENPYTFAIAGSGVIAPEIEVLGNNVSIVNGSATPAAGDDTDFGDLDIDSGPMTVVFTIRSAGSETLSLTGTPLVSISGSADFTIAAQPDTATVVSGDEVTFDVTFDPAVIGEKTAVISIASNDADENPFTFAIKGTGTGIPEIAVIGNGVLIANGSASADSADHTDFGDAEINQGTVTRTFTIENSGVGILALDGTPIVDVTGADAADFEVSAQPSAAVNPAESTVFQVRFDPSATGNRTAVVSIASNDPDEDPYTFAVSGNGITAPEIEVAAYGVVISDGDTTPDEADSTDFGVVPAGSRERVFTIRNPGSVALSLGDPAVTVAGSGFALMSAPSGTISPGDSASFTIRFMPSGTGVRSAVATIASDDADESSYTFTVRGSGPEEPADVTPSISLMAPNGGETWLTGTQQYIVWNPQNVTSGKIEYSLDNGATWQLVELSVNIPNGSYLWTIPVGYSDSSRVRITSTIPGGAVDTSAGVFTIAGGVSPVRITDLIIAPVPDSANQFQILADLQVTGTAANVRISATVEQDSVPVPVTESYGSRDADADGDINTLAGIVTGVQIGTFSLDTVSGSLLITVDRIRVGGALFAGIDFEKVIDLITGVTEEPTAYAVSGFYPNPFNPVTAIRYTVPVDSPVRLAIYDISGRLVTTLVEGPMRAGTYSAVWNARDRSGNTVASGLYLYRLTAGAFSAQGKVMFLK